MTEVPRDVPKLIEYLEKVIEGPKDGKTLSQVVCYLKESIVVLVQTDNWGIDEQQSKILHDKLEAFVDIVAKALDQVENLEKEVQALQELLDRLNDKLIAGQVALRLDREIVKLLLKGTDLDRDIKLVDLAYAVKNNTDRMSGGLLGATESQRMTINLNYDEFEKKFNSDVKRIYQGIKRFKDRRNFSAHPNMLLKEALERLSKSDFTDKDKESIQFMITILESLNVTHIGT